MTGPYTHHIKKIEEAAGSNTIQNLASNQFFYRNGYSVVVPILFVSDSSTDQANKVIRPVNCDLYN
jgi:hypothetical protein